MPPMTYNTGTPSTAPSRRLWTGMQSWRGALRIRRWGIGAKWDGGLAFMLGLPTSPDVMSDSLQGLALELHQFAHERDWHQFHSPKNLASALIVEAGELLEHFQWLTEEQSRALSPEKLEAVGAELADVLLYLVQLASTLGIDPIAAAQAKLKLNELKYPIELARGNSKKYDRL